ncbi:MAG TPA: hypothetical protein VH022_01560 [Candidatus Acidoferrum sp.]|nr:hypothetical protein [Candidatus Acidoferrum sp.]
MNEYRITKYNPEFRNESDNYTKDEWTVFKQIGDTFSGLVLTTDEYKRVEDAYVQVALSFLRESGSSSLRVAGLENHQKQTLDFSNDQALELDRIGEVIRPILREEYWCRLEGNEAFLHFSSDYYMYIGVPHPCPKAEALAAELGLYVEECASPIRQSVAERIAEDEANA